MQQIQWDLIEGATQNKRCLFIPQILRTRYLVCPLISQQIICHLIEAYEMSYTHTEDIYSQTSVKIIRGH